MGTKQRRSEVRGIKTPDLRPELVLRLFPRWLSLRTVYTERDEAPATNEGRYKRKSMTNETRLSLIGIRANPRPRDTPDDGATMHDTLASLEL